MGLLSQFLAPPPVPPLDLPFAARHIGPIRKTIEAAILGHYWYGAADGWSFGFLCGVLACLFASAALKLFGLFLRGLLGVIKASLAQPPTP